MHVLAAMSGGVDSSVAALRLVEAGHRVTGVFLSSGVAPGPRAAAGRQGCCSASDAADAARVADLLGIAFYPLDFSEEFAEIVEDFAASYARGRTPNPCVLCNRDLKFGRLFRFAGAIGADRVATGHYAALEDVNGRAALRVPADWAKDQTYVLFPLSQEALRRTLFPLAELTKDAVRETARRRGLPVAEKPESMEICFVPDGDYRSVLSERAPQAVVAGDVVDEESGRVLGRHAGIGTVTIGQRRGLGALASTPRYVTGIDAAANVVRVGPAPLLLRRELVVEDWNPVAEEMPQPGGSFAGFAKVRRAHVPQAARITAMGERTVRVVFEEPVKAAAPGQALVVYDERGFVIGGGFICSADA
jgi:tRNA-uridine 2-sulfurtransferase